MAGSLHYPVMIEPGDVTTAYGVVVPDLPGCFSAGDSFDDAMSRAAEAIALWIEAASEARQPVPSPSSLAEVKARMGGLARDWMWGSVEYQITGREADC